MKIKAEKSIIVNSHILKYYVEQTVDITIYYEVTKLPTEFTKEMKKEYTILAPDIFPSHMGLLQEIFRMYGYNLQVVHYEGQQVIDTGLQYLHNDMCYPAICSIGQLLYALKCGDFDPQKTALLQFQTGGGCRASNYIWLLRKALKNMGMDYVPVISLSFSGIEKQSGFKITPLMLLKGIMAVLYGDMIMLLRNQVKPYEITPGSTLKVVDKWNKELIDQFKHNKGLIGKSIKKNMDSIAADFHAVPVKRVKKTKVGIVGEIYVKYSQFGNNGLESFLESEGCEFMVPGVLGFVQYCFSGADIEKKYYGGSRKKVFINNFLLKRISKLEKYMLDALKPYNDFIAPASFAETEKTADKVIDRGVKMGEGWLLPAEMAELIEKGYNNIVCAQPFGCLPNHIAGKGVIRTLKEMYPESNICPVDYDAGASKVNQENRIKLMLSVDREEALV